MNVYCLCKKYKLSKEEVSFYLDPLTKTRHKPEDFTCPECGIQLKLTLKSGSIFILLVMVMAVLVVSIAPYVAEFLEYFVGSWIGAFIAILLVAAPLWYCLNYVIWPRVIQVEESKFIPAWVPKSNVAMLFLVSLPVLALVGFFGFMIYMKWFY